MIRHIAATDLITAKLHQNATISAPSSFPTGDADTETASSLTFRQARMASLRSSLVRTWLGQMRFLPQALSIHRTDGRRERWVTGSLVTRSMHAFATHPVVPCCATAATHTNRTSIVAKNGLMVTLVLRTTMMTTSPRPQPDTRLTVLHTANSTGSTARPWGWQSLVVSVVICVTSSLNASALEPDEAFRKLYGRRLQCVKAKVTAKWSIKKFSDGETYALDMSPEHGQATITFNDEVPIWKLEMDYDTALNSRFLKSGSMKNKRLQKDDFILAVELESDRYLFNPFYGGRFLYTWPSSIRPPRVNYKVMYPPIHPRAVG